MCANIHKITGQAKVVGYKSPLNHNAAYTLFLSLRFHYLIIIVYLVFQHVHITSYLYIFHYLVIIEFISFSHTYILLFSLFLLSFIFITYKDVRDTSIKTMYPKHFSLTKGRRRLLLTWGVLNKDQVSP